MDELALALRQLQARAVAALGLQTTALALAGLLSGWLFGGRANCSGAICSVLFPLWASVHRTRGEHTRSEESADRQRGKGQGGHPWGRLSPRSRRRQQLKGAAHRAFACGPKPGARINSRRQQGLGAESASRPTPSLESLAGLRA